MTAEVDLIAPCALGGVLNDDTVPALRCKAIAGAANNQLADDSLDAQIAERGILWAPDFVCNAGGIINICVELEPEGYDAARADANVRVVGDTLRTIFDSAAATGTTPLTAALELGRERLPAATALFAQLLHVRAHRDRGELADVRGRVGPRGVEQLVLGLARPPPAPPAACARARRGGRGTRRASPPGRSPGRRARGRSRPASSARSRRRPSRYSRSRPDTNTLPWPSTASPVKAAVPATNTRWSSAWPGMKSTSNGVSPTSPWRATGTSPSRSRSAWIASEWSAWSCVSAMPPAPPRAATSAATASTCDVDRRPGVDHPRRIAPDDPRVGPGQRQRARVGREDARDLRHCTKR